ncbi:MAG: hypothetical protein AAGD25_04460 [Cyanobacteria bacterium P01_F01_bin.150]
MAEQVADLRSIVAGSGLSSPDEYSAAIEFRASGTGVEVRVNLNPLQERTSLTRIVTLDNILPGALSSQNVLLPS